MEAVRLDLPEQLLQVPVRLAGRAGLRRASPARRADRRAGARGRGRRGRRRACGSRRSCGRAAAGCGGAARRASAWRSRSRRPRRRPSAAATARAARRSGGVVAASSVSPRPMRCAVRSRPSSTCSLAIAAALRVTDAVTNGLPSRSPPTHEPMRTNGRTIGARPPAAGPCSASSTRRYTCGTAVYSVSSNTAMTARTSSVGDGLLGAQRRGAPQRVDLLEHAALGAALVGAVAQRRVVLLEQRRRDGGCWSTRRGGAPRSGAR